MSPPVPPATAPASAFGPQPSPRERLAIAALALAAFALNLNTNVLGALLPFVRQALGVDEAGGKLLVAAAAAGSAVGSLLFAPIAARHGRRPVMVYGLAVFVVASALHLVPGALPWLLTLRAVSGLAVGIAYAAASALSAEIVPYHRRGAAMGRFNAGMFLAIPVGMPLSVWLASLGYWPGIFGLQAVVGAVGCWLALRHVPIGGAEAGRASFRRVLRNGGALAGLLATGLHVGSFFTTVQLATTWLDRTGRVHKEQQLWLWVGLGLASVVGSLTLGRLSDRIGKRNFVLWTSAALFGCFVLLAREPADPVLAVLGGLLAVIASARTGPLQALVSHTVPPEQLGALMSLRGFVMQLGVVGFALAAVPVADRLGFQGVLLAGAVWQLLSYVLIRFGLREAIAPPPDAGSLGDRRGGG
ncbi:MAG: MFS transporter [Planctomycetes bacterium]|nr:MFS transporter [Planctomycetota bacterium]